MNIQLTINSEVKTFDISPKDRLLDVRRRNGYFGVKHGCDDGSCGACAVLMDDLPFEEIESNRKKNHPSVPIGIPSIAT